MASVGNVTEQRRTLSRQLARAIEACGLTQKQVAEYAGMPPNKVNRHCCQELPELPNLAEILSYPPSLLRRIAELCVQKIGCAVAELPEPDWATPDELRRQARLTKELVEVISHNAEAIADGHITRAEATTGRSRIREAIASLTALDEFYQHVEREHVVGVPSVVKAREGASGDVEAAE